jgi:hypothetical protein
VAGTIERVAAERDQAVAAGTPLVQHPDRPRQLPWPSRQVPGLARQDRAIRRAGATSVRHVGQSPWQFLPVRAVWTRPCSIAAGAGHQSCQFGKVSGALPKNCLPAPPEALRPGITAM